MRFAYAPHPAGGGGGAWGREYIQREDGWRCSFCVLFCFPDGLIRR